MRSGFHDLLGICGVPCPDVDPDARTRRLVELITIVAIARPEPAIYIVEDAQWIDRVSESLIAEFAAAVRESRPRKPGNGSAAKSPKPARKTCFCLFYSAAQAKWEAGEATESLQLAQRIIDVADGDPIMGDFVIGSPLAWALTIKGAAGMFLGRRGWRDYLEAGITMSRSVDAAAWPFVQLYKYQAAMQNGAVLPRAHDVAQAAESLEIAKRSGNNTAVAYALMNRATTLMHNLGGIQNDEEDTAAGFEYLTKGRKMLVDEQLIVTLRRLADIELARGRARSGDLDGAIELATTILGEQADCGEMLFRGPATTVLVETLVARASALHTEEDIDGAERAIDTLAAVPTEPGFVLHELPVLRLRALVARARGDEPGYREFVQRLRARAHEADFEGYLAQAEAMA